MCSIKSSPKLFFAGWVLLLWLTGCTSQQQQAAQPSAAAEIEKFDGNSWQQLIPASCLSYFDGCNNCRRNPDNGIAACTRMACAAYAKPYCLDAKKLDYQCDGGNGFTLWYGEYQADDQKLRLQEGQVMFSDRQTHVASVLNREVSASGERYSNGKLTVFAKSKEAFVEQGGQRLYTNCQIR